MSSQTSQHIWQMKDLDPSIMTIMCLNRKFIRNVQTFDSFITETEKQTKCSITILGLENQDDLIWIIIKSESVDSRRNAFYIINAVTDKPGKEIILPKFEQPVKNKPANEVYLDDFDESSKTNHASSQRKSLIRSTTTDSFNPSKLSLNSMSATSKNTPFSSILSPIRISTENDQRINRIAEDVEEVEINNLGLNKFSNANKAAENKAYPKPSNNSTTLKKRYSIDFLLARADTPSSKTMPKNWKELNEKYPNICFCGKVISYFNPYKYYSHWNKTIQANPDLHYTSQTANKTPRDLVDIKSSFHTDDFINLKSRDYEQKAYKRFEDNSNNNYNHQANSPFHHNGSYRKSQQFQNDFRVNNDFRQSSHYNLKQNYFGHKYQQADNQFFKRNHQSNSSFGYNNGFMTRTSKVFE